ncbi:MAG: hypothetical protein AB203_03320 [Parcubacteria bacterium C7867-008]|nr:MAG: hypothetical protein AB203_03320 [Parcubacteria bacterium C7867-008]
MDTVVTTPGAAPQNNSAAGWVIAVILLIALIGAGAYAWTNYGGGKAAAPAGGSANINVTLPTGSGDSMEGGMVGGDAAPQ